MLSFIQLDKDEYIKSLIEDVNRSYNQIKNFNYKEV